MHMDPKRPNASQSLHSSPASSFPFSSTGPNSWRQSLDKGLKRLRQSLPRLSIYYTDDDLREWTERCWLYNLRTYGDDRDDDDNFAAYSALAMSAPPTYGSKIARQRFTFNEPSPEATAHKRRFRAKHSKRGICLLPLSRSQGARIISREDSNSSRRQDFEEVLDPTTADTGVERHFQTRTKPLKSTLPKFKVDIELSSIRETRDDGPCMGSVIGQRPLSSTETAFYSFEKSIDNSEYFLATELVSADSFAITSDTESFPSHIFSGTKQEQEQPEILTEPPYCPRTLPKTWAFFDQTIPTTFATERCFPHFSVWISSVQIAVFVATLLLFGWCPFGPSGQTRVLGRVLTPNLVVDHVCRVEYRSYFLSLRQSDLIRLGASFAPCMRPDESIQKEMIERQKAFDRASGCCMRNDGSGCYQTLRERCSYLLSTWLRHDTASSEIKTTILNSRSIVPAVSPANTSIRAGPVCGLDPNYCLNPHPTHTAAWNSNDVTTWPVCHLSNNQSAQSSADQHMRCEVTGRPCCVGIRGECIITTREHCEFVQGLYNPKASLCSQVNCLEHSCGLWSFINPAIPDQFYRPILSLFIHENLPVLLLSVLVQLVFVRRFEQFLGWWRIAVIFLLSSLFGSVVSVCLQPHQVGSGPSHIGVLLAQLVDFYYYREWVEDEYPGILCISLPIIFLFLLGFLPSLDNIANLMSAVAGILLYHVITTDARQSVRVRLACGLSYT
ncbi:peptidase, S54 family, partial [Opisthorchis viverrini]